MSTRCNELTKVIQGITVEIEDTRVADDKTTAENNFKSQPLAGLSAEDQSFAVEFVRCHGINAMRYNILR